MLSCCPVVASCAMETARGATLEELGDCCSTVPGIEHLRRTDFEARGSCTSEGEALRTAAAGSSFGPKTCSRGQEEAPKGLVPLLRCSSRCSPPGGEPSVVSRPVVEEVGTWEEGRSDDDDDDGDDDDDDRTWEEGQSSRSSPSCRTAQCPPFPLIETGLALSAVSEDKKFEILETQVVLFFCLPKDPDIPEGEAGCPAEALPACQVGEGSERRWWVATLVRPALEQLSARQEGQPAHYGRSVEVLPYRSDLRHKALKMSSS